MSYDLAVWEGPRPATAADAAAEYEKRMDAMEQELDGPGDPPPPTPGIRGFVEDALAQYPELTENSGPECPWASAPLIGEAMGDLIYFPMTFSGAEYARDVIAEIAHARGLVCYDPQVERLLPDQRAPSASSIAEAAYQAMDDQVEAQGAPGQRRGWLARLLGRD